MATTQRDYYEILEIARDASEADLKKAYRKLAMQFHPDRNAEADAADRFKEINSAYEVLSDPAKRARYDRYGHAGVEAASAGGAGFDGFHGFEGFGDIFDSFFAGNRRGGGGRRGPARGADLRYNLAITFEEAAFGTEKEINYERYERCGACQGNGAEPGTQRITCPECHGAGEIQRVQRSVFGQFVNVATCVRCRGEGQIVTSPCTTCAGAGRTRGERRVSVKIPAGVDHGAQIRLTGEGDFGSRGGGAGNLYVALNVEEHEYFERNEDDVWIELPINIAQAALGTTVNIPTLDGSSELAVPPGTQSNDRFTLRGKGVPHLRGGGRGDQVIIVDIAVPKQLTDEQRALLQQLAATMGTPAVGRKKERGFFERLRDAVAGH